MIVIILYAKRKILKIIVAHLLCVCLAFDSGGAGSGDDDDFYA